MSRAFSPFATLASVRIQPGKRNVPLNKPFTGPEFWKSLENLALSCGVMRGKAGGGDFGIDNPVLCGANGA